MRAVSVAVKPIIRLSEIFIIAAIFLIAYNRFLVNQSLDDLKFALNSIEHNEYAGLDQLLSFNLVSEASKEQIDSDTLATMEYVNDILPLIEQGRSPEDVMDIMRKIIAKKEEDRGAILSFMDRVTGAAAKTFGIKPKMKDRLIKQGQQMHNLASQKEALLSKLSSARSPEEKQQLLYKIGTVELAAANYPQAIASFKELIALNPDSRIGARALFSLAWCEKAMGNTGSSNQLFQDLANRYSDSKLARDAQFQSAMLYRKDGKYQDAADALSRLATSQENSALAPVALFLSASTYLYDLNDEEAAKKAFEKLKMMYPANAFSSSKAIVYKRLFYEEEGQTDINMRISTFLWELFPLTRAISETMDIVSTRFVIKMIEGTIKQIALFKLDVGDTVKIERTDEFLTSWCNNYLKATSKDSLVSVQNVHINFREGSRVECKGGVRLGTMMVEGRVLGKMMLKPVKSSDALKGAPKAEDWMIYDIEEARMGPIVIPPEVMNAALARSHKIFNQKLPFKINKFKIDMRDKLGIWEGQQTVAANILKHENPEMYQYLYRKK